MRFKVVESIGRSSLVESSLSRLYKHNQSSDIGFITAYKSPRWVKDSYQIEDGVNASRDIRSINQDRNDSLEKNLKALGYNYFKVVGSYENQERKKAGEKNYTDKEQSFAVINTYHNADFVDNLLELAKKYNQESILIVPVGGKNSKFYYTNGSIEDGGDMTFGKDAPFKSLVSGRPMVLESATPVDGIKIRTAYQYNKYKNAK